MEAVPKPYVSPEPAITKQSKPARFLSQPIPPGSTYVEEVDVGNIENISAGNPSFDRLRDKRFDSFKTWSGRLERQLSHFRGRQREPEPGATVPENAEVETLPADRYFDALEGPELDTLRVCLFLFFIFFFSWFWINLIKFIFILSFYCSTIVLFPFNECIDRST